MAILGYSLSTVSVALYALLGRHSTGKTNSVGLEVRPDFFLLEKSKILVGQRVEKFMNIQKKDPTSGWLKHH